MIPDEELLERFRKSANSDHVFGLIVRKYQQKIYWHVRRLVNSHEDANDIVQNIFIKSWMALPNFRGDSGLYTWLYRIATNEAISFLNRNKSRFMTSIDDESSNLGNKLAADFHFDGNKLQKEVQKAIQSLPEKQRVVFCLRYFDEMKYEEMAEVLDTSVGALKASYHHAAKKVEKFIAGN